MWLVSEKRGESERGKDEDGGTAAKARGQEREGSRRTLDVLNAKLLDEPRREDSRGEGATKDGRELVVEPADAHVLEPEVGLKNRVRRWPGPSHFDINMRTRRERTKRGQGGETDFLAEALILMRELSSFRMETSVSATRMPMVGAGRPAPDERSVTPSDLTDALRLMPLNSNAIGSPMESGRPGYL